LIGTSCSASASLTSDDHRPFGLDTVHLADGLGDAPTDGGNRAHGLLLCRRLLEAAMLPHRSVGAGHSIKSGHWAATLP